MKFAFIALVSSVAFSQLVSAQSPPCAAQEVLSTCLSNEDTYLKTCIDRDYACLCKWHKAKLSCYDNCPNDLGMASVKGLKDTYCSIAQTYNTTVSAAPSVAAPTVMASSSASVAAPSSSSSTTASSSSTSNHHYIGQGLMFVAGVTAYFLI